MNYFHLLKGKEKFVGGEFLGIPIFDEDLFKLVLLLGINLIVTFVLVRLIYYPRSNKKREYLFAFMMVSVVVFFLAFALKSFKFNTGIALGLFAIFGIIRFRTSPMPIKEMSYFFAIIGISLINALSNKLSLMEVALIDGLVLVVSFMMEFFLSFSQPVTDVAQTVKQVKVKEENYKDIVYGWLENVKPANRVDLIKDLEQKTGLTVVKVETKNINLKKGEALLRVHYEPIDNY